MSRHLICVCFTLYAADGYILDTVEVPRGKGRKWSTRHWKKTLSRLPGVVRVTRHNAFEVRT